MPNKNKHSRGKSQAQYRSDLRRLQKTGLYTPTDTTLTDYRKKRINQAMRENKRLLNKDEFFFVKAPFIARKDAEAQNLKTTSTGIFVERENYETATLHKIRKKSRVYGQSTDYVIDLERKIKRGVNQGKIQDKKIALSSLDALTDDEQRLRRMAASFGTLRKNQLLGYVIHAYEDRQGAGYSHNLYADIDLLLDHINNHGFSGNSKRTRNDFSYVYRTLTIERTTVEKWLGTAPRGKRYIVGKTHSEKRRNKRKGYGSHKGRS